MATLKLRLKCFSIYGRSQLLHDLPTVSRSALIIWDRAEVKTLRTCRFNSHQVAILANYCPCLQFRRYAQVCSGMRIAPWHIYNVCRQIVHKQPELMKMFVNTGALPYAVTVILSTVARAISSCFCSISAIMQISGFGIDRYRQLLE